MKVFDDIIEILLQKKAALREEIEREFAERSEQINDLLLLAGYDPSKEVAETIEDVAVCAEYAPEATVEIPEAVAEVATQRIY